jgi:hypothetical protein
MDGLVQHQRLRDALELEGTDLDETESARRDVRQSVLSDEDMIGPRLRRDARRDVDRPAEVVALLVDHGSGVHSYVGGRQTRWTNRVHDLQRCRHRVVRILEVEVHTIAEHLDDMALVTRGDFVHQLGELQRDASRNLIPRLLGQPGVPREIREGTTLCPPRCSSMHSRFLERGLDMAEHVLHLEHLRMASVQPSEEILA